MMSAVVIAMIMPVLQALDMGKPAPEIQVSKWVKNGPVHLGAGKNRNIFVIEFWATWCPPCLTSIPHLSDLQAKYKDQGVVVVGITKEDEATVKEFVTSHQNMDYHVALDKNGETNKVYMKGIDSIPTAFVIDKQGIVVWRGHPMQLDKVLAQVLAGTFDYADFKKLGALQEKFKLSMQMRKVKEAAELAEEILYIDPNDLVAMQVRLMLFQRQGQQTAAIAFLDSLIRKFPKNESSHFIKLSLLWNEDPVKIKDCAESIMEKFKNNAVTLNRLAWDLLENGNFGTQPLGIALAAAEKGLEMTNENDKPALAANTDTLARCYYSIGRIDKAIELQTQALVFAKGTVEEKMLLNTLDFYRKAKKLGAGIK